MHEQIKVHVVKYASSANLLMRYRDPILGKQIARTTGTTKRREAERSAAKWEAELREGRYRKRSRMSWEEFVECYEADGTGGLKPSTVNGYMDSLAAFGRICRPSSVADLTTARITGFARELRKPYKRKHTRRGETEPQTVTRSEASVSRHLRHLKLISRWANRQGYLTTVPTFDMPKRSSGARRMKGRPITTEEFERMLAATESIVGSLAADSWKLLLRGLWASGLRLGEAMALRWDNQPECVTVRLDGCKSVLAFDADSQKSGKVELAPLAPEAVELLEPMQRKRGYVFHPQRRDGEPMARHTLKVSKIICRIGKAANVQVNSVTGKSASAHDLRRAFGYRWSRRIMPAVLKELMRHASIETTMTFYVGQNAETTAEELWAGSGKVLGKVAPEAIPAPAMTHQKQLEN